MNLERLAADQDEDSCQQCEHARQNADAEAGEREDTHGDQINREQKHADVFCNHVASIWNVPVWWQSKIRCWSGESAFIQRCK